MDEVKFTKYARKGAYHWRMVERSVRNHNAFLSARYEMIRRLAGPLSGSLVLDMGCGDGVLSHILHGSGAELIGVDIEPDALVIAKRQFAQRSKQAGFASASAYALPFGDSTFDVVASSDVIEHVQQPERMLGEMKRVLKANGRIVISTPIRYTEHCLDPLHVHEYYPDEFQQLLERFFKDVTVNQSHPLAEKALYEKRSRLFGKRVHRVLANLSTLYFNANPFLSSNSSANTLMTATGTKK